MLLTASVERIVIILFFSNLQKVNMMNSLVSLKSPLYCYHTVGLYIISHIPFSCFAKCQTPNVL